MPPFEKPKFTYNYRTDSQIKALRRYRETAPGRQIPEKAPHRLLVASWNIANLGMQQRREKDYRLIAELLAWFDLIALQEVNDNLQGLQGIMPHLPSSYRALFSDKAGNNERLAFIYDRDRVRLLDLVGEIAIPPREQPDVKLADIEQKFRGFDRNPHLAGFESGEFVVVLVNVHMFFGKENAGEFSRQDMNRRSLETYAVARWADLRRKSKNAFCRNIIPIGDFNLPLVAEDDPIYAALTKRGLHLPTHSTEMGSSISRDRHYDQLAFFPGPTEEAFVQSGVFDFDGAVFAHLWEKRGRKDFNAYVRYYLSDHRILWAEFSC